MGALSKKARNCSYQDDAPKFKTNIFLKFNPGNEPNIDLSDGYAKIVHMTLGQILIMAGDCHD